MNATYTPDEDGYVNFGDVSRGELREQCQYASLYVTGRMPEYLNLGKGLRFRNLDGTYHDIKIHIEDVPMFIQRFKEHQVRR